MAQNSDDGERWTAPDDTPLTVVAHNLRVRYKVLRTDRSSAQGSRQQAAAEADGLRGRAAWGHVHRAIG